MTRVFCYSRLVQVVLISGLCTIIACGSSADSSAPASINPEPVYKPIVITSGIENGHPAGIRLSIQRTINTDTTTAYTLISSYENRPIGLILIVPRTGNGIKIGSGAFFKTLGYPSDLFLHLLASEYKQHMDSAAKFTSSIHFICLNLTNVYGNDSTSSKDDTWIAAEYKLFFDSESEDGDAEMFMNINTDQHWVEFAEKDDDYRTHLINLFTQH